MRRILSTSLAKFKNLLSRALGLPASEPIVLTERYEGVLLEDPFPEVYFDDSAEQRILRQQLNALLDKYYQLHPFAMDIVEPDFELLPAELTKDERIDQVAAQFLEFHEWPITALPLVKEVFYQLGWSATKEALDAAIENGMTVKELELCFHLKTLWESSDKYAQRSRWQMMSWPSALYIIRSFRAYPQKEELDQLIEHLYDGWQHAPLSSQTNESFFSYIVTHLREWDTGCVIEGSGFLELTDRLLFNSYEYSDSYDIAQVQLRQRLLELGVI